jgi:hypothetical protein
MTQYERNVFWGKMLVQARRDELRRAEQNLANYIEWWERFINYCHTGK